MDIPVISDEIYADLSFEDSPCSFLSLFSPKLLQLTDFQNTIAMTGWRLGYMITPPGMDVCRGSNAPKSDDLCNRVCTGSRNIRCTAKKQSLTVKSMKVEFNRRRLFVLEAYARTGYGSGIHSWQERFMCFTSIRDSTEKIHSIFVMKFWKKQVWQLLQDAILEPWERVTGSLKLRAVNEKY